MLGHTATERQSLDPDTNEQVVRDLRAPDGGTQPGAEQVGNEGVREQVTEKLTEVVEELKDRAEEAPPEEIVAVAVGASAVLLGTAVLVVGALFAAGFLRRPIERAVSRLILRIQDIQVSSGLPLVIMDIFREMRADMNVVSAMSDDLRATR